ncbi:uroporphyrinogen-III C-methyltransferase [Labilibacter sediminis]|nr:uroporphyrinogen-III C-methyltransferase [Labilibacter sediminis]
MQRITIHINNSKLSIAQAHDLQKVYAGLDFDILLHASEAESNGEDDKEVENVLEDAVINGDSDVYIALANELPYPLNDKLDVFALLPALDQSDALVSQQNLTLTKLPYGARVGITSLHQKNKLKKERSDLVFARVDAEVENLIFLVDSGEVDAVVVATSKLESLNLTHRISEKLKYITHSLQGHLAVVGEKSNTVLKNKFKENDIRQNWGRVVLAGFGPGDKWLITKRAEYNLHRAEVIFYDDLVNEDYLNRFCARKIYVGKRKGQHKFDQQEINELMYRTAKKGKWVVRIKGGDPLIFGRGAEEYHYLQSRFIEAEIIPGITSAFAAAASSVIPLTERSLSSSVVFLSGHDLNKLKIPKADTLVFYMGASNQMELANRIMAEGWSGSTPVGVVYNASNHNQQVYRGTLREMKEKGSGLPSPSIIIVGKTAQKQYEHQEKWLYTGISADDFKAEGHVVHTPLISIEGIDLSAEIDDKINRLNAYQRIVFTSRYSVHHFFRLLFDAGKDVRSLSHLKIDSIGKTTTKALREYGLAVAPLSELESSAAMVEVYQHNNISNENVLIPRSNLGTSVLPDGLKKLGNNVSLIKVYHAITNKAIIKQDLELFSGVVFTSPSTVKVFVEVYKEIPSHLKIICKGAETKKVLQDIERNKCGNICRNVI